VIVAIGIYSLNGGHYASVSFASPGHAVFAARPIAPMLAGATPRVTIDDPNSGVHVSVSHDGLVHVTDATEFHGSIFGANGQGYPQLSVSQDAGGVHISRPSYDIDWMTDATSSQHIEIEVPAGATLTILHCDGATVGGLNGGDIAVQSDDGAIEVSDITTSSLQLNSNDGHIDAQSIVLTGGAPTASVHSDDGHVTVDGVFPAGGKYDMTTNDGSVGVALGSGSDATIDASTDDGEVRVNGERRRDFDHGDPASGTLRVGGGSAAMQVHSNDGTVAITTNGAI
jgi:hypothetical protein